MGDRISIQFRDKDGILSPVLFSHWDGKDLLVRVKTYHNELYQYHLKKGDSTPLSRMESQTVMVDFIRHISQGKDWIDLNYYLGISPDDGDNSDNGHHIYDLYMAGWITGGVI